MTTQHTDYVDADPIPAQVSEHAVRYRSGDDGVALRREAATALDSFVRPMLRERLSRVGMATAPVYLTIYDEVYRRSAAGAHWDAAVTRPGLVGHSVQSLTVALEFDSNHRAARFVITAASRVVTEDATPEALARGLDAAERIGPMRTWASNTVPALSL